MAEAEILKDCHQLKRLYYVELLEFSKWCDEEQNKEEEELLEAGLSCVCSYVQNFSLYTFCSLARLSSICLKNNSFWEKQGEKYFHSDEIIIIPL